MRYSAIVAGLLLAAPAPAAAMCMGPQTALAPASGSLLPEDPSVFLFVPRHRDEPLVTAWTENGEAAFEMSVVSKVPSLTTYRIDVSAAAGSTLTVRVQDPEWERLIAESRFEISGPGRSYRRPPISVLAVTAEVSAWTCSYQESHNVLLSSAAPAFRVVWAANEADYVAGKRRAVVLPAEMRAFYGSWGGASSGGAMLQLGHVSCFGHTLEWVGTKPVHVGIEALHADGTAATVVAGPLELGPPERALSQWLMEDYVGPLLHTGRYYLSTAGELLLP